jgi:hypothetical protein
MEELNVHLLSGNARSQEEEGDRLVWCIHMGTSQS